MDLIGFAKYMTLHREIITGLLCLVILVVLWGLTLSNQRNNLILACSYLIATVKKFFITDSFFSGSFSCPVNEQQSILVPETPDFSENKSYPALFYCKSKRANSSTSFLKSGVFYPLHFLKILTAPGIELTFLSGIAKKTGFLLGIFVVLSFADVQAATISSTGTGGNWSSGATWVGGVVPASGDDVSISAGSKVTIDTNPTVESLSISGTLEFEVNIPRIITVVNQVTISSNGIFQSAQSGAVKTHQLIVLGSIINDGTINFSSNSNETGVEIIFSGSSNAIFNCSDSPLTNLRQSNGITLDKGTSAASVLSFTPGNKFQVLSDASPNAKGFLSIINGTFNIIGSNRFSNPVFCTDGNDTIPATGGFWLGNQNATVIGMNGTVTNLGDLKITNGTYQVGTSVENSLETIDDGQLKMSGGILNIAGKLKIDGANCIISSGKINIGTQGKSIDNEPTFHISGRTKLEIYGNPLITIAFPSSKEIPVNDIQVEEGSGSKSIAGGAIQLGTEVTPSGSSFFVDGDPVLNRLTVFNECTIHVFNTSKSDLTNTPVSLLPKIVFDKTAPEITAPQKITIQCGENIPAAYTSLQDFTRAGGAASDNCNLEPASFKFAGQVQSRTSCPYMLTRTYEISDISGNVGTAKHLISVEGEAIEPQPEALVEPAKEEVVRLKSATATITSTATGGNWNSAGSWVGGVVPGLGDDVTIVAGATITLTDNRICNDIAIAGTLAISGANTLQVNGSLTNSGAISSASGKILLNGNWTNSGTYNGGTNGIVEFTGAANATISGTTNFEELIISKGSLTTTLTISGTTTVTSGGSLIMNSGLVTIPATGSFTVLPHSLLTINKPAGFDITGGTMTTDNFSITNEGLIRISSGTANFGNSSGNSVHTLIDGAFIVSGGTVNIAGRLENTAAGTLNPIGVNSGISISGGTITLSTVGNGLNSTGSLDVTANGNFVFSAGTIVFQNESTATTALDLGLTGGSGTKNTTGGTFQFGNASTLPNSVFNISGDIPLNKITSFPNADLKLVSDAIVGQMVLDSNTSIDLNGKKLQLSISASGMNYTFPTGNGTNLATLILNFTGISTPGSVTISSSGTLPSGFLLNSGTVATPIYITNSTVSFSSVSGSYLLPSGFTASQKVGLYNGSWSYQPAAATVNFSGWTNLTNATFVRADCTTPVVSAPASVCVGSTATLSPTTGGIWASSNTAVATVTNAGVVTGVSSGSATFTFTETATGCSNTTSAVTVNALPVVSTPSTSVCVGSTITLSPTSGGTWTSSNVAAATVTNAGVVTGVAAGSATFTFTNSTTNCSNTTSAVTVNALPVVSTPSTSVCVGSTITLSPTSGGTWTSSNVGAATVTNAGVVTGVAAGSATFTFTNSTTNCSNTTSAVTVNALPVVSTPSTSVCVGSTITLSPTLGGTWTSSNVGAATVTNAGVVTGVAAGSATFTFTNSTTNCSNTTSAVTVNALPVVSTPSTSVCVGSTITLSPTSGGTWTSSNVGAATVTNAGVVTGVAAGSATFTFTNSTTNCSNTTLAVTVNPLPVATATPSAQTICSGDITAIALSSTLAGTTYSWTVADSPLGSISGASAGTGSTIAQTLVNTTAASATLTYTITPMANTCPGAAITVVVTVKPRPTLSSSLTGSVCSGLAFSYTPTSNVATTTFSWTRASVVGIQNLPASGTDPGVINETLVNTTGVAKNVTYRYTLLANGCSNIQDVVVIVSPAPTLLGTLTPSAICSNSTFSYTAMASITGTILNWTRVADTDNPASSGTGNISETLVNTTSTDRIVTYVYSLIGACTNTQNVTVTISPTPTVTLPANLEFCNGENVPSIVFAGPVTGTTYSWANNDPSIGLGASGIGDIPTFTATNTSSAPITAIISVRPKANGCIGANSTFTIVVYPASKGGTANSNASVCGGTNSGTLTLTGRTGTVDKWQSSTDGGGTWADISNTTTSQTYSNIAVTTQYRAMVISGNCSPAYSSVATITVNQPSVGGAVTSDATVCSGTNSGTLTLSGQTGTIQKWQMSINNGVSWNDIANTSTTQTYTNLSATTLYRVVVQNGACPTANSSIATVTVDPVSVGGSVSANATVCSGSNSGTLTLSGQTGNVNKWQSSTDGGSTWVDISNLTTSYTYTNLSVNTQFRAVVQSGTCSVGEFVGCNHYR